MPFLLLPWRQFRKAKPSNFQEITLNSTNSLYFPPQFKYNPRRESSSSFYRGHFNLKSAAAVHIWIEWEKSLQDSAHDPVSNNNRKRCACFWVVGKVTPPTNNGVYHDNGTGSLLLDKYCQRFSATYQTCFCCFENSGVSETFRAALCRILSISAKRSLNKNTFHYLSINSMSPFLSCVRTSPPVGTERGNTNHRDYRDGRPTIFPLNFSNVSR